VQPGSSEEIVMAVKRLLGDPDFACRLGEQGRAKVLSDFSIENEGKAWHDCYAMLLDR
jgi:hypothetical protein